MKDKFFSNTNLRNRIQLLSCVMVFAIVAAALWLVAGSNPTKAVANKAGNPVTPQGTFAGTNTGAIPDGLSGTPPQFGAPRVISFAVSGVLGNVTDVSVDYTITHTWVGDVEAILAAPGGTPSLHVASRIGVTTGTSFGDSSNYGGTYNFTDTAAGSNIWTVATAAACGDACIVTTGSYRTTQSGQTGQTNPAPVTSLNTTFSGLTPAQATGTWTLTFRDAASADIGSVTAANLIVGPGGDPFSNAPLDFNGDGKTDYVVVRNVGGGASGQVRWFYNINGGGATVALDWGLATDFFFSEDFDNDNKDDIACWRPGAATVAAFYILNSATNTARVEAFGQSGDDPTVVDDYNNDGSADIAVYRPGASAGLQSTWFYRTIAGGAVNFVPWGVNGDFPAPGDYDGDGSADFVVQRNNGGGQAAFWRNLSTAPDDVIIFGTPTDVIVPGDYDGDAKIDLAVIRGSGGAIQWWVRGSIGGAITTYTFGLSASDFPTQGDYDGDGKTDIAVWRPNADPTQNFFYSLNSSNAAATIFELGQQGDYPVANYNAH
jgi:subtilisin-like proprotein convertase family protein